MTRLRKWKYSRNRLCHKYLGENFYSLFSILILLFALLGWLDLGLYYMLGVFSLTL